MKDNKGFTLIELLAVIIILGVLMLVAIPSVTTYINNSRKSAYIDSARKIMDGAIVLVNSGELDVFDTDTTYYIPGKCIPTETGGDASPYAKWKNVYIMVTYDGDGFDYYWASTDETAMGIKATYRDNLNNDSIKPGINEISTSVGVGSRSKIIVFDDCETGDPTPAMEFIDEKGTYTGEGGNTSSSTTTTDNRTWTNGIYTLTFDIASSCDTTSTEKVCNVTITGSNSDSSHLIVDSSSTFTVPSGTRIAGGPYTSENIDVTVSGTTLTVIGNKNYKHDRFTSSSNPRSTSLRIAYPKDAEFVLSNGNINFTILSDAVHVYDLTNMKVTLTRTGYYSVGTHKMKIKNTVKIENKTNNTLSGWSFRISANGLTSANIINPLKKISEGTNYVVVGPVVNNSYTDSLPPLGNTVQEDKIEFVLDDINSEITIS